MKVVLCTTPSSKSEEIAKIILEEKLCACVNIIPSIKSMYWWNDEIQTDVEDLLFIKTESDMLEVLTNKINEIHPYDIPEVIALDINGGSSNYMDWIKKSLK